MSNTNGNAIYVAIKTDPKATKNVVRQLSDCKNVKQCHTIVGRYDLLLMLESGNQNELYTTVLNEIRSTSGVTSTETWPVCRL